MSNIIVTGITTGVSPNAPVSSLPQRLEWHNFVQSIEQVTLYVKALQQWMQTDQSSTPSYFRVAGIAYKFAFSLLGIHGLPFIPWDGVQGDNPTAGYCNHGSSFLFLAFVDRSGYLPDLASPLRCSL